MPPKTKKTKEELEEEERLDAEYYSQNGKGWEPPSDTEGAEEGEGAEGAEEEKGGEGAEGAEEEEEEEEEGGEEGKQGSSSSSSSAAPPTGAVKGKRSGKGGGSKPSSSSSSAAQAPPPPTGAVKGKGSGGGGGSKPSSSSSSSSAPAITSPSFSSHSYGSGGFASSGSGGVTMGEKRRRGMFEAADSGEEEEEELPKPASREWPVEELMRLSGPRTTEDSERLPDLNSISIASVDVKTLFEGDKLLKKHAAKLPTLLKRLDLTEDGLLAYALEFVGGAGGVAVYMILARGVVFSKSYRHEALLYELAKRVTGKAYHKVGSPWRDLPGGVARERRTLELYNFLVEAAIADSRGFFRALAAALKTMRGNANTTILNLLDQIHTGSGCGPCSLRKSLYELCMAPLDDAACRKAGEEAVEALGGDMGNAPAVRREAEKALRATLDGTASVLRFLRTKGEEADVEVGMLDSVLDMGSAKSKGAVENPIAFLTPLAAALSNSGRSRLFDGEGTEGLRLGGDGGLSVNRKHDPLDGQKWRENVEDEGEGGGGTVWKYGLVGPGLYFFALLSTAHWMRTRSFCSSKPTFSASSFPSEVRLWEAVTVWHARLEKDLPRMGIGPQGGDTLATWGFYLLPAELKDDLRIALTSSKGSPAPPSRKRARKGQ